MYCSPECEMLHREESVNDFQAQLNKYKYPQEDYVGHILKSVK